MVNGWQSLLQDDHSPKIHQTLRSVVFGPVLTHGAGIPQEVLGWYSWNRIAGLWAASSQGQAAGYVSASRPA